MSDSITVSRTTQWKLTAAKIARKMKKCGMIRVRVVKSREGWKVTARATMYTLAQFTSDEAHQPVVGLSVPTTARNFGKGIE